MAVIDPTRPGADHLPGPPLPPLDSGSAVEVRNHFDGRWASGFVITDATSDGYRVRRMSDGRELPVVFDRREVRPRGAPPLGSASR